MNSATIFPDDLISSNDTLLNVMADASAETMVSTDSAYDMDYMQNLSDIYGPTRDPLYVVIPITCIYMLIFISGVVGNISTCIVISKNRSMHTATNYYLFSLAVSDFLLLLAGVPQEIYSIWSKYPYVFGEVFCVVRGLAAETAANATVLTITAFTVERYVAICYPFLSHTMSKLSRAVRLIILVWLISVAMAVPQALQFGVVTENGLDQCSVKRVIIEHSFEVSTFAFFIIPMSLITVLYVLIGLKLRTSSLMPRSNGSALPRRAPHASSLRSQTNKGTRRVLKMLVAVVVAFFLCWAPFHAQRLVAIYGDFHDHMQVYLVMTYISGILYYLSTCINPLLYNLMSNKFRAAFKATHLEYNYCEKARKPVVTGDDTEVVDIDNRSPQETLANCCIVPARDHDQKRSYRVLSRGQRQRTGLRESTDNSGSSLRDESMYSTSTQKQSIDSTYVTVSSAAVNGRSGFVQTSHSKVSFDSVVKVVAPTDIAHHATLDVSKSVQPIVINGLSSHDLFSPADGEPTQRVGAAIYQKKPSDIRLSVVNVRPPHQSKSKILGFLHGLVFWRPTYSSNSNGIGGNGNRSRTALGYYSPQMEHHQMDEKSMQFHIECGYMFDGSTIVEPDIQNDKDLNIYDISDRSLQNDNENELEDELTAYMAELRAREER